MSTNVSGYMPLKFSDLNNQGSYKFIDVSSEEWRTYHFVTEFGDKQITIQNPVALAISASGHRLLDDYGNSHFIPTGWIHLTWRAKPGLPHFVK